ncbi:MAG: 1,4-dihydroxy-6-naphthoate synthase [Bacteroidetes bacterium]|nr:1,4-dihydroxy-6-naphthoate synthase [Bacteroidota bacterium]
MNKISLAFSPCPNDTFIFDAMVHHKIDTEGFEFEYEMADVEELNQSAFNNKYDVCKVSYHAYLYLIDKYVLLHSGSALGEDVGPLFISKKSLHKEDFSNINVAVPGKYTTASLLLSLAYPEIQHKQDIIFSAIEEGVLSGKFDAGVIIHENRFTYHQRGLQLIADLGKTWYQMTQQAIPLGGIVIKRDLAPATQLSINRILKRSIEFAFKNPDSAKNFIRCNAQEMSEEIMYKHINLYVNDYTIDLGRKGRKAVTSVFEIAVEKKLIAEFPQKSLFL